MRRIVGFLAVNAVLLIPAMALAQQINFGGMKANTKAPVEVTADQLNVNQDSGQAVFSGNVLIAQDQMRLKAPKVEVNYAKGDTSKISTLHATGGVTLVSATDAAEAQEAVYDVAAGTVVMTGNVLLTQGDNVMSGNRLDVDLSTGMGQMQGRVRTILTPGKK
ncbi:organic solvent tolerance protein OstA [Thioclava dalianensis]|uniref:Organic solvent tolerance protein OstA n=1 Tax=Thioclava dalianensis TaxID=1185766 RepID=A0A074TFU5_9RHOB|nr:lipopolysaccharide transport periplasmic protein LptA [Thioclava dalianensis]KEP67903.1 organic solvent tolerance protein OstA [Thioclava dalianensis]SFM95337.1 lipopolysaccharide export system protein LptA [Thioclava dalianensis]